MEPRVYFLYSPQHPPHPTAAFPQIQHGGRILPSCSCFVSLQEGSECAVTSELLEPAAQPGEEGEQGPHHPQ